MNLPGTTLKLLWASAKSWWSHDPFRNAAIIAYYAIFSLPGLLVISINLAGYFVGEEAVTERVANTIESMIGSGTANSIIAIMQNANEGKSAGFATGLGIVVLVFGATGVFYQIQQTLNKLWEVEADVKGHFFKVLMDRLFSFGLVLTVCFLLLMSLIVSAVLNALGDWLSMRISESIVFLVQWLDLLLSFGIVVVLFAAMFKILPDAEITWKEVWTGAAVTAILFILAETLIGLYFGASDPGSTYGAAGSIILIMLWVSYSSLILLYGAEFTRQFAEYHSGAPHPSPHARSTSDDKE